ncbi:SRPBCC family protein [Propioniciclava sp.]|uniref:SRPBCC family protein n=1 Tax=Propioniciclava sp. TaxID=2038686 RepID=UPI00261545B0|nr:SRPBCC family protein [Propioniciclava sp.]
MTTKVEKSVVVDVPLSTVYNQWTQFEEFPRFMHGVEQVTQLSDDRLEWIADIAGVRRQWIAKILEQVPDRTVAWASVEGVTNAGAVTFADAGDHRTTVHLTLEFEPEGVLEDLGDRLGIVERLAEGDLERFKEFIETEGHATGAWRGSLHEGATVRTPGVEDAASSWGDSGKVGDPAEEQAAFTEHLTGPTTIGTPPLPGDHGLNPTDAAAGFGEPGVVRDNESGPQVPPHRAGT